MRLLLPLAITFTFHAAIILYLFTALFTRPVEITELIQRKGDYLPIEYVNEK